MSDKYDPKKIINFDKDYYSILGIEKNNLPKSNNRQNKIEISKIIEEAFRKRARKCHPDFGGSNEEFLDLVRARRILEDPYLRKTYDQGYFDEFNIKSENENDLFQVDWQKIGNYRKGSPEDTVGFSLFFEICKNKEEMNLIPAFFPSTEEHNYEWDWVLKDSKFKLSLSLVNDENEVLRLTNSSELENSLPFKIYICIPQNNLNLKRKSKAVTDPHGKTLINGQIEMVNYSDINLLETTNLNVAKDYILNKLKLDINLFFEGKLQLENTSETKWLSTEQINKVDLEKLKSIINMRSFEVIDDEKASEFLNDLSDEESYKEESNKPSLPV